jgi:hypothetical protein
VLHGGAATLAAVDAVAGTRLAAVGLGDGARPRAVILTICARRLERPLPSDMPMRERLREAYVFAWRTLHREDVAAFLEQHYFGRSYGKP